jgi:hypothetical protein
MNRSNGNTVPRIAIALYSYGKQRDRQQLFNAHGFACDDAVPLTAMMGKLSRRLRGNVPRG